MSDGQIIELSTIRTDTAFVPHQAMDGPPLAQACGAKLPETRPAPLPEQPFGNKRKQPLLTTSGAYQ